MVIETGDCVVTGSMSPAQRNCPAGFAICPLSIRRLRECRASIEQQHSNERSNSPLNVWHRSVFAYFRLAAHLAASTLLMVPGCCEINGLLNFNPACVWCFQCPYCRMSTV